MTSKEIRKQFLDFFQSKGHLIVPSAPLVAKNDPTLMFNNSGMAQFKDFFLGNGTPPSKRIADTQKCLRVSGKHNDLEDVGFDTYHHTMFEMLGNWSFGDYFKKEALAWSWELLTEVFKLPKDRIYVSVFQGDEKDGVPFDQEAWDIWASMVGEDRIILGNKKDNFWEMGDTGPCGPCSEIHIDLRDADEVAKKSGKELVNADHPQVVEIWNNVFMQFERMADGSLVSLPAKHVDTGMGFERLCMAIQGKQSNYDTDVFSNTINFVAAKAGKKYGDSKWEDIALRVIADHIRAIAFAIADGQLPSNNKAGYVIRRILRRAVRYGYTYLGFREPFMHSIIPLLAEQFDGVFPELIAQQEFVERVILEEENSFLRTLETGLTRLDKIIAETEKNGRIAGEIVFELNDTFGFPSDLTALIARENGLSIDEEGYKIALQAQKDRSRKDSSKEATDWTIVSDEDFDFEFVGYDETEAEANLIKYRKVKTKAGSEYHIVLDKTPFYAEMGGQVGDSGVLELGDLSIKISDTKKENDLFIHISTDKNFEKFVEQYATGKKLVAKIDTARRSKITSNHTATHLMLSAMREVLGSHISQKGSYQNEDLTRFDFSHFSKVTDEELAKIEDIVNAKIRANIALDEKRNVPIKEAVAAGATATFGEKYGDFVRVITFDPNFSVELCGGTHVPATGQIGLFKFVAESSVSAGVRRVEAYTGQNALAMFEEQLAIVNELKGLFKGQSDVVKAVKALLEEKAVLSKKIEAFEGEKLQAIKENLLTKVQVVGEVNVIAEVISVPSADALKQLAYELKAKVDNLYCVLGSEVAGKPQLAVMIADNLVADKGLNAGQIIRDMAKEVKGGGGGQPFFATAGGSDVSGLAKAIEKGRSAV
ncbi:MULTISPECIES: alanine--tRNA ligase [unclassified Arcicella]|uniref:alanine--tRNA ligase n=1 Tax=unclassified Arcicella TaxID=2644986 RepID=UPI00285BE550|nr:MULTISPECIES: alanine--tRNA ligase [unclassified Arcicella]MDR6562804.1 alanyl-tRNA synthetase [Arcicella sp. BE51]MDR6812852.1 alanyl-tRNA synthetase [Arcicella sp. BE140]MDR6824166.1 alanyl-tRNA synthetase [Arcicella sp. BE139]